MIRFLTTFLVSTILTSLVLVSCDSQQSSTNEEVKDTVNTAMVEQDERIMVKMTRENGVYTIPASVNGLKLKFVFDTGASDVCISLSEAIFMLKNNYLNRDDLVGATYSQIANGSITENTSIKIKSIEIGGMEINDVSAQIIHNLDAPLLLGQSAIQKLGKIELNGDSLVIVRKVKKETGNNSESNKTLQAKEKKAESRSAWEKFKDFLGIHDYQADLDSLVCASWREFENENYLKAQKCLSQAEQIAEEKGLTKRNWEILYIKAKIDRELASSINESWKKQMPLLKKAYDLNTEKKDGIVIEYKSLLSRFANGLAQQYDIYGEYCANEYENLFNQVVNELMDFDEFEAYCYSARYYSNNLILAKKYCQKAIDLKPNASDAYITMGIVYFMSKDYDKAKTYYDKALGVNISDNDKGFTYRLSALCYNENSYSYIYYMRLAAKYDDKDAINILKERGLLE